MEFAKTKQYSKSCLGSSELKTPVNLRNDFISRDSPTGPQGGGWDTPEPGGKTPGGADSMQDVRRRHPAPNYAPAPRTLPPGREKGIPWTHTPSPACTSHTSDATTAQQSASCSTVGRKEPGPRPPQGSRCRIWGLWGRETRGQCGQAPPTTVTPVSCRPEPRSCGVGTVAKRCRYLTRARPALRHGAGRAPAPAAGARPRVRLVLAFGRFLLLGLVPLLRLLPLATFFES